MTNKLTEAPIIKLSDADLTDPKEINLKRIAQAAADKEAEELEAAAKLAEIQKNKDKYADVYTELRSKLSSDNPKDILEFLFDRLVPSSGMAETIAGELVRATMRILYRYYNDGDLFFSGYGLDTCGGSAEYLLDQGIEFVDKILNDAETYIDSDDEYETVLDELAEQVVEKISSDENLMYTNNSVDSRSYSNSYIAEHEPKLSFEIPASDDIVTLVEKGVLSSWDLINYAQDALDLNYYYRGAEIDNPWGRSDTSVTVTNLNQDQYTELNDMMQHHLEQFWKDLVDEYHDELSDEDDYDDDYEQD